MIEWPILFGCLDSVRWPARRGGGGTSYPRAWGVWVVQGVWHPGRASVACGRPGTGPLCPRHHALPPTEQRTGADRPQRPLFPVRVSVPGGGGSPRALGGCCAALVPGVAQSTRRPGPTASGHALRLPLGRAATPTRATPASGEVAGGGCAPPVPSWWSLSPGRGLAGASRRRARALTRPPVVGVVSPCAGARAWQGRGAPPPALWGWRGAVPSART
jgi:hypothetical protein